MHEGSKLQLLLESANITHKAEQASAETVACTGKREKWQNCADLGTLWWPTWATESLNQLSSKRLQVDNQRQQAGARTHTSLIGY